MFGHSTMQHNKSYKNVWTAVQVDPKGENRRTISAIIIKNKKHLYAQKEPLKIQNEAAKIRIVSEGVSNITPGRRRSAGSQLTLTGIRSNRINGST